MTDEELRAELERAANAAADAKADNDYDEQEKQTQRFYEVLEELRRRGL
jgi:hypothetical protein